jgi:hypothetical protein
MGRVAKFLAEKSPQLPFRHTAHFRQICHPMVSLFGSRPPIRHAIESAVHGAFTNPKMGAH